MSAGAIIKNFRSLQKLYKSNETEWESVLLCLQEMLEGEELWFQFTTVSALLRAGPEERVWRQGVQGLEEALNFTLTYTWLPSLCPTPLLCHLDVKVSSFWHACK